MQSRQKYARVLNMSSSSILSMVSTLFWVGCGVSESFTGEDELAVPAPIEADSPSSGLVGMVTLDASGAVTGSTLEGARALEVYRQQNRKEILEANARKVRICEVGVDPGCELRIVAEASSAKMGGSEEILPGDTPCPPWKACSDSTAVYVDEYEYKVFRVEVTNTSFYTTNDQCVFAITMDDAEPSTGQSGEASVSIWKGWSYKSSGATPSQNPNSDAYCQYKDSDGKTDLALYGTSGKYSASDVIICKCPADSSGNACTQSGTLDANHVFKFGIAFLHNQVSPGYHIWIDCGQSNAPNPSETPMPDISLPAATDDCPEGFYQSVYKDGDGDRAYLEGLTTSSDKFVSGICVSRPYRMASRTLALAGGDTQDENAACYPGMPVWNFNPADGTSSVSPDCTSGAKTTEASEASTSENFTSAATWLQGMELEEHLGYTSAAGTDLNGDGLQEVVLCGWNAASEKENADGSSAGTVTTGGRCYLVSADSGSPVRGRHDLATLNLGQEDDETYSDFDSASSSTLVLEGMAAYGALGEAVAAGDINGDGLGDLILAAPGTADTGIVSYGRVYILLSDSDLPLPGSWDLNDCGMAGAGMTLVELKASGKNTRFGAFVGSGADLDGDGKDELLIGEPGAGSYGQVYLLSGAELTAKATVPTDANSECGIELEVAYAPTQANFPSLVTFAGSSTLGTLGYAGALLTDFTGDAWGDVALLSRDHAPSGSKVGAVHFWWGTGALVGLRVSSTSAPAKAPSYKVLGTQSDGMSGAWLKEIPSLNNDGVSELALAMPAWDGVGLGGNQTETDIGALYVLFGGASRSSGSVSLPAQGASADAFTTAGVRLLYGHNQTSNGLGQGLGLGFDAQLDSRGNVWLAIGEPAFLGDGDADLPQGRILWGVRRVGDDPWLPGVGWDPNGSAPLTTAVVWAESTVEGTNRYGRSVALVDLNPKGFLLGDTADDAWMDLVGGAVNAEMTAATLGTTNTSIETGAAFLIFGKDPSN